jgi:hypothetical protein
MHAEFVKGELKRQFREIHLYVRYIMDLRQSGSASEK